jgi:hypothetical protein
MIATQKRAIELIRMSRDLVDLKKQWTKSRIEKAELVGSIRAYNHSIGLLQMEFGKNEELK